eukprot:FR743328.1.p1 GENE.FR743328.1~~FR743328.1.p1  ORF type:complete len:120 (+),score=19.12 FR743328.1:56-361(+)
MGMGMGGGGPNGFNAEAAYKMERENLDLVKHKWALADAEKKLLGPRYPAKALIMDDEFGVIPEKKPELSSKKMAEKELREEKLAEKKALKKASKKVVKKGR